MIERIHHPRIMRLPRLITDPEGPISQARLLQLFRRALHDREAVSGDPLWGFSYGREFLRTTFVFLSLWQSRTLITNRVA